MKKYLMTAAAALILGGLMTSCTKDTDYSGGGAQSSQDVQKTYEEAFLSTFGRPVEGLDWGFGLNTTASTRAQTRALPQKPSFSSQNAISEPLGSKPSSTKTFYNTAQDATNAGVTVTDAKGITVKNKIDNQTLEINSGTSLEQLGNCSNVTLYIAESMTFSQSFSANGNAIVVTSGKTLTLSSINQMVEIYLAPGAKLIFTNDISVERGFYLYMCSESTLEARGNLTIKNGSWIVNHGGTVQIGTEQNKKNLTLENNCILWNENAGDKHGSVIVYQDLSTSNDNGIIYNASNCSITASKLSLHKYVVLWDAGTINIDNDLICVNDYNKIRVTNAARLEVGRLELKNNYDLLTNEGTLISGEIKLHNYAPELDNYGTLQGTSMTVDAGAKFHNMGPTTITGKTYVYNTNSRWMNDDLFICDAFELDGGSNWSEPFVFNNCKLIVNGKFHQNHGYFVLDGGEEVGASVVCESFEWTSDNFFLMGSKSLLRVTGEMLCANRNSSPEYGFHGEGDDYAVIQAGSVQKDSEGKYRIAYYGNLYVDTQNHFSQGQASDGPWYFYGTKVKFSFKDPNDPHDAIEAPVSIPAKGCSPGYNTSGGGGGGSGGVDPDATEVMVVAEDLSTYVTSDGKELADFDFNDVVFEVSKNTSNGKVHIKLLAAGGTLPLTVGGTEGETVDNHGEQVLAYEVHRLFKVSTGTMVNTNATSSGAEREPVEFDIPYPEGVNSASTIYEIANAIPIRVNRTDLNTNQKGWIEIQKAEEVSTSATRITASKLCVDKTYTWCNERIHIDQNFQYIDAYGNNKGSRFRMYLRGELKNYWWRGTTTVEGN